MATYEYSKSVADQTGQKNRTKLSGVEGVLDHYFFRIGEALRSGELDDLRESCSSFELLLESGGDLSFEKVLAFRALIKRLDDIWKFLNSINFSDLSEHFDDFSTIKTMGGSFEYHLSFKETQEAIGLKQEFKKLSADLWKLGGNILQERSNQ